MTLSLNQVKRHLQDHGLVFGLAPDKLDRRLEKLMGRRRFEEYLARLDDSRSSGRPMSLVYELFESLEEANLVMSHQSQLTSQIALWLQDRLAQLSSPAFTIVDLGCWTGGLSRVLARAFPHCKVLGVDRLPRIVDLASEACRGISNLQFRVWDYSDARQAPDIEADALVSSLGIDFQPSTPIHSLDVHALRESPAYRGRLAELRPYMASWRSLAVEDASLFAVLRLSDIEALLALSDAAYSSHWRLLLEESAHIPESSDSKIPALSLRANDSPEQLSEDDIVSWLGWPNDAMLHYRGTRALAAYRSLGDKIITRKVSRSFDDGHTMAVELGRVGALSFLFARATTGYAELKLGGLLAIDNLAPSFGWEQLI